VAGGNQPLEQATDLADDIANAVQLKVPKCCDALWSFHEHQRHKMEIFGEILDKKKFQILTFNYFGLNCDVCGSVGPGQGALLPFLMSTQLSTKHQ
jgi:hypothetical protein